MTLLRTGPRHAAIRHDGSMRALARGGDVPDALTAEPEDEARNLLRLRVGTTPSYRFLRFLLVGSSGTLVDMAMLFLLSDPRTLGLGLTRSKLVAAEVALISNFLLNDAWTFRDLTHGQRTWRHRLKRLARFNVICGIGLGLSVVLLNLQFNLLGMNRYVANAVAIALAAAWNYRFNLLLGWRDTARP